MVLAEEGQGDYNLFEIMSGDHGTGPRDISFGLTGLILNCVYLPKLDVTAMYISKHTRIDCLSKESLLRVSRVQFGYKLFPYGGASRLDITKYILYINKHAQKLLNRSHDLSNVYKVLDGEITLNRAKISSNHLRHVTVKELSGISRDTILEKAHFLLPMLNRLVACGVHENLFVGLLCWALFLPEEIRKQIMYSDIWWWEYTDDADFFDKIKKDFTSRLKAVQNLLPLDLTPLFELEVLVNRGLGQVNWRQEEMNRTEPTTVTLDSELVYKEAVELFGRMDAGKVKPRKILWGSYWSHRWEWAPTGAYHSQYKEDEQYRASESTLRNKFYSLNRMPDYDIEHFLNRPAEMVAWPSTKYEWGKQRAIYGVDITNFILSGYALAGCEDVLAAVFPIGKAATTENVKTTVKEVLMNGVPYCFDFEDFNSQHTISGMQAVLRAYGSVFSRSLDVDQLASLQWTIDALENTWVRRLDGSRYKCAATLLSGWRLTTFMNTVLNYIYTRLATKENPIVSTHNGDDVLCGVTNLSQVQELQSKAASLGVRFQKSKCYLGAVAEFLRVDHYGNTGAQYLPRAVSTFVHGPTESSIPNDIVSIVKAIDTRRRELLARKADVTLCNQLTLRQLKHSARMWDMDVNDLVHLTNTHVSLGGITDEISEQTMRFRFERIEMDRDYTKNYELDSNKDFPGVEAYATLLTNKLIDVSYKQKIQKTGQ
uniref:RNA-directed RNA polymerase n=1 Tax=Uromyces totivirus B TaxID=2592703 RepID=A0A7G3KHU2_9VIRU|nr:putative RdRp [Uromyces totivirus B]